MKEENEILVKEDIREFIKKITLHVVPACRVEATLSEVGTT